MNQLAGLSYSTVTMMPALMGTVILAVLAVAPALAQEPTLTPDVAKRVAAELQTRRFDSRLDVRSRRLSPDEQSTARPRRASPDGPISVSSDTSSLRDTYASSVNAVPLVIAQGGIGSGVVVAAKGTKNASFVVTNEHVVTSPFLDNDGRPFVILMFYEPELARESFDASRTAKCLTSSTEAAPVPRATSWCRLLHNVVRAARVVASDTDRDLALLVVSSLPPKVRPISPAKLDEIRPGDPVSVIGHPLGLVWTLTTGIVSAVRSNYKIGDSARASGATVIQTQTPVHPGNSGGPLLTAKGHLVGVIFGSPLLQAKTDSGVEVKTAAAGLNLAIAVTEVQDFIAKHR